MLILNNVLKERNTYIHIHTDLNCKTGKIIEGNTEEVSKGGKVLLKVCKKLDLTVINGEKCCKGLWTRIQKEKRSVLDYIITKKQDLQLVQKMVIDENKIKTPYRITQEKEIVYTDHCMMVLSMALQIQVKDHEANSYLSAKGYEKLKDKIESQHVSNLIDTNDFDQSYSVWSKKITELVEECSTKKKKSRGWKVNRKLETVKKQISKQLKNSIPDKESIRVLKVEKNLINEHIEEERKKKHHQKVNMEIDNIKKEGGVDSTAFWELKRRIEGRTAETAHVIENEEGEIVEDKKEILKVYERFYQKLLATQKGETENELEIEEIVMLAMNALELIASAEEIEEIEKDTLLKIVNGLKNKKAKDVAQWKNEYIKSGGNEMLKSIKIIMKHIDKTLTTPSEWNKMNILSIHKKGPKTKMKNKRGLFITNLISKVYERIIKDRNKERSKVSPMQTGGIKERSTIDNVMTILAIIERNNYLNKTTFLTFADVEKCFDKLWLDDGIKELWKNGMGARDCMAIKKLNELAEATVKTPIGSTEEIKLTNIVRQGTVNGPPICAAVMDTVNSIGYDSVTHYGPYLIVKTLAYVDDLGSAGGAETANRMIMNCNIMEERKKITFNTDKGKSAYLVIHQKKGSGVITATVKKGEFEEVEEYKYLGVWLDKTGQYRINILKKKEKIPYMISSTKRIASTYKMGKLSTQARLKMMNIILTPSIIYNAEAYATFSNKELELLEGAQAQIIRQLLELPISTPYLPLLLETGTWTMEGRIHYKKLMLFHNITNSSDERILKNIISEQMKDPRPGTWYHTITES